MPKSNPFFWLVAIVELRKVAIIVFIEREGDLKDTQRITLNAALNVDIFQKIF